MAGAAGGIAVRRHEDGSLDIDFYRERARRLRCAARRRLWRGVRRRTADALASAVLAPRRERHVPA